MPLYKGEKNIGKNINTLLKEGYSKRQSLAIALSKAGKNERKRKRNKTGN